MPIREELFHPMLVHFPIALLFFAAAMGIFITIVGRWQKPVLPFYLLTMALATVTFILSIYTGDIAEPQLRRQLGLIKDFQDHVDNAYYALYLLFVLIAFEWGLLNFTERLPRGTKLARLPFWIAILYFLVVSSHHGARLVYEHGAGVRPMLEKTTSQ